jgi:hypothetical protein
VGVQGESSVSRYSGLEKYIKKQTRPCNAGYLCHTHNTTQKFKRDKNTQDSISLFYICFLTELYLFVKKKKKKKKKKKNIAGGISKIWISFFFSHDNEQK